jgi:hypothetical protein
MSALRRYEILPPLVFNDGTLAPEELLADNFHRTAEEIRSRFMGNAGIARRMGDKWYGLPG